MPPASLGRLDEYCIRIIARTGSLDVWMRKALDIIECLWLKFNQIVYLRNKNSAKYFAGFPIGFNIAVGGQDVHGEDVCNELSFLFCWHRSTSACRSPICLCACTGNRGCSFKEGCSRRGKGSGMPQFFNDEAIIAELEKLGISIRMQWIMPLSAVLS